MPRRGRGRISPEDSADLRHRAAGVVSARAARGERPITGAELARELEVSPQTGRALLAHLRDLELAPPAVVSAAGRQMAAPPAGGRTVWLSAARLERLAAWPGEDPGAQLDAVLDAAARKIDGSEA